MRYLSGSFQKQRGPKVVAMVLCTKVESSGAACWRLTREERETAAALPSPVRKVVEGGNFQTGRGGRCLSGEGREIHAVQEEIQSNKLKPRYACVFAFCLG